MTLNVYVTRNKKSGQYGKPAFEVMSEAQIKESYTCSFLEAPEEQKLLLRELEAYKIGEYNTETGKVEPCEPLFLLDLGSIDGKAKDN